MSAKEDFDDDLGLVGWLIFTLLVGGVVGCTLGLVVWGEDAKETRQEACEQFVQADYVEDIKACVRGDEIVHRFEEED